MNKYKERSKKEVNNKKFIDKQIIIRIIAGIVLLSAILVIFGWIFDIAVLKSILPQFVAMKFLTAVSFLFTGIILLGISKSFGENDFSETIILIISIAIILLMGLILISALLKINLGIENLFIKEASGAVKTTSPGMPSIPTMVNFVLIGIAGLLSFFSSKSKIINILGMIIGIIGVIAVIGYIINQPYLYYYFPPINTAIALNTSILFVFIGIAFYFVRENEEVKNK